MEDIKNRFKTTPLYRRENHPFVWALILLLLGICMFFWWASLLGYPRTLSTQSFIGNEAPRALPEVFVATKSQIVGYVASQAQLEGLDVARVMRVAQCESQFSHLSKNKKSSASGIFQITLATQQDVEKRLGKKFDVFKPEDNIEMAFYFMRRGQWNKWQCK